MSDWLKKQQRKKIPYGFFKTALDSRKEVSVGGLRRISTSCLISMGVEGLHPVTSDLCHRPALRKEAVIVVGSSH